MKGTWNASRIILAVLLTCVACVTFVYWPKSAAWHIPDEDIVGFDEIKGLLITVQTKKNVQELHSYNLNNGSLHSSTKLPSPTTADPIVDSKWPLMLSPGRQYLVAASYVSRKFLLYFLPAASGQWKEMFDSKSDRFGSYTNAHGYSQNGGWYLTRTEHSFEEDAIHIWDLESKKLIDLFLIPHRSSIIGGGLGMNILPPEQIHVTADRRYLAASMLGGYGIIYDLKNKKVVVETEDHKTTPRFSKDGKTIVFLSYQGYGENTAIWYQLVNDRWIFQRKKQFPLLKQEVYLQVTDDFIVTAVPETNEKEWYAKLPEFCQKLLERIFPSGRVNLRFWDLLTGEEQKTLAVSIPEPSPQFGFKFGMRTNSENTMVSRDARYIARVHKESISVWETSSGQSLACWLISGGVLLLALRIAWPQRSKG